MSAQESCLSLIKYFLFVFNLFFFVLGSLIFCFGIWILIDKTSFVSFVGRPQAPIHCSPEASRSLSLLPANGVVHTESHFSSTSYLSGLVAGLAFVPLQIWSKVLAISGIFTMGIALLGCVGALKELRCLLGLYFGMLLLLFATQITLGILISTQRA
ncbi:LOW QUALITY PROTEIN: CD37 isoform 13, partial [Pan troglodytes]